MMNKSTLLFIAIISKVIILFLYPSVISDVAYYYEQSNKLLLGFLPYTDFKFEYPPLAIIPIWLSGFLSKTFAGTHYEAFSKYYRFLLFFIDLGFLFYLKAKFESKSFYRALICLNIFTGMALGPLLYDRLDLIFGLIAFASMMSFFQSKKMQGLSFAVLGIPFKLITLIFIPFIGVSFFKERDFHFKSFLKWVAIPSGVFLIALIILFKFSFLNFLTYHHLRGIQIESTWATVEYLIKHFSGMDLHMEYNYGAQHLRDVSPFLTLLANYSVIVALALLFFQFVFFKVDLTQMLLTSLLVFITFGKVLSPQFLIWFIPLIFFFVDSKSEMLVFGMICLLTTPIIFHYGDLINQKQWAWWCINSRNLLLVSWSVFRFLNQLQFNTLSLPWKKSSRATGLAITPE